MVSNLNRVAKRSRVLHTGIGITLVKRESNVGSAIVHAKLPYPFPPSQMTSPHILPPYASSQIMASITSLHTSPTLPSLLRAQTPKPTFSHNLSLLSKSSQSQFHGINLSNPSHFSIPSSASVKASIVAKVTEGTIPPAFTLKDQNGKPVSLSKFKGKPVVVYFYPADETPGCTKQEKSLGFGQTEGNSDAKILSKKPSSEISCEGYKSLGITKSREFRGIVSHGTITGQSLGIPRVIRGNTSLGILQFPKE
ncbi:peroxiredoxin q chloroplastic [Phtheirospermum japonicum]|uniref:Peroxiredoxin Q, chloroplastic n=1 Tax=Phtheirospermum japonicum TaxID=374723 RepID=A0A830BNW2_9LAMI|nr:peroxiredoxin q chloroplastic [Phtheirospermum japonicum]